MLKAVSQAFDTGVVTQAHIVNQLNRLLDPAPPEHLLPPATLTLLEEPKANTSRYDDLREVKHV